MADNTFKLRIISPERVFYEGEAIMLECRTTEGEIGILKNHIPLTAVLAPGVARIKESDTVVKAALISGFQIQIQIQHDSSLLFFCLYFVHLVKQLFRIPKRHVAEGHEGARRHIPHHDHPHFRVPADLNWIASVPDINIIIFHSRYVNKSI